LIPINSWAYNTQAASIRHIGPTAQDFYRQFGLGEDERYINSGDVDGVALASLQALVQRLQAQQDQITRLEEQIAALETRLQTLENEATGKGQPEH